MIYITLFVISFLAATILPLSSEITLAGLMSAQSYNNFMLLFSRYNDIVADLPWLLVEEPEPVVVLHSNQRITMPVLQSHSARL